jgi:hypothetical protein
MKNIVEYNNYKSIFEDATQTGAEGLANPTQPAGGPAGAETAPKVFGEIDFSVSGVNDDAMKLIAGLMAQTVLASGEAEKISKMAETDPNSAASYLQQKIEGILSEVPGTTPTFIGQMKSQGSNIAKAMVQAIPGLLGNLTDKHIDMAKELKPDPSKTSFLTNLAGFFQPHN